MVILSHKQDFHSNHKLRILSHFLEDQDGSPFMGWNKMGISCDNEKIELILRYWNCFKSSFTCTAHILNCSIKCLPYGPKKTFRKILHLFMFKKSTRFSRLSKKRRKEPVNCVLKEGLFRYTFCSGNSFTGRTFKTIKVSSIILEAHEYFSDKITDKSY